MQTIWSKDRNLSMLMDFYELTMSNAYFENGLKDKVVVFDMFFRAIPDDAGFAIFAGLEQLIQFFQSLSFTDADIDYLKSKGLFNDKFLEYLKAFEFKCDVWALKEGTPMFPKEPIVVVRGPIIQAQLVETMVLLTINHQSLIATKANRLVRAANGRDIMEFGSRRAQSYDAAVYGARAAYIGGCSSTACVIADRDYKVPAVGTMAHSWVQTFDSEYDAFRTYANTYPDNCTLLVDTYSVVKSGIPNAIKVFNSVLKPLGKRPRGVRIDSGDIAYLSKKARKMLDDAGYTDCKIVASNALDEYIIRDLLIQDAKIDVFGVGENLITSSSTPVLGGVYKLVAIKSGDSYIPKIKKSETVEKVTTPAFKTAYRFFEKETGKAIADYVALFDETIDPTNELVLFNPNAPWKRKTIKDFVSTPLLVPIFADGKLVYDVPKLDDVRDYCLEQVSLLWDEVKRFEFPHTYYVDLSQKLYDTKQGLLMGAE